MTEVRLQEFRNRQLSGEQGSTEWLARRADYITASATLQAIGGKGAAARMNLLLNKATYGKEGTFGETRATALGHMFEPVTGAFYEWKNGAKIHEFNLIPNDEPEYPFLGASTDGVTNHLVNIEIKCLVSRKLDATKFKEEYWHQMQQQMYCLDLPLTHFLEFAYNQYDTMDELASSPGEHARGIIFEYMDAKHGGRNGMYYEYSPMDIQTIDELRAWESAREERFDPENTHRTYVRTIYWSIRDYLMRPVKQDPEWIVNYGPLLKAFWNEVVALRADPARLNRMLTERAVKKDEKRAAKGECPSSDACMI